MAPPAPGSLPYNILLEQLSSSNEELEMRKEEVLLLRSHMVRQEALKHRGMLEFKEGDTSRLLKNLVIGLCCSNSLSPEEAVTVEVLLQHLSFFHTTISQHGMDSDIIKQVVRQQFYFISAVTLNNLLLRKDMCSWGKGLQIRYCKENTDHTNPKTKYDGGYIWANLLKGRDESSSLMMDAKKIFSVTFPFTPSSVALETIQIPTSLNLGFLIRV
ncbi:hypothetical protein XENOCAPTIV_001236 [Xenoophorus captivus]|uniref:Dilute domain-containing protein n=1 Tax=Xenoophorus captivus TaxID=1517983 RepID=A0ABV0RTE7_9TELE